MRKGVLQQYMADGGISATGHELPEGEDSDTSGTGREHGDGLTCDERCYVDTWTSLLRMELAAEQGPIDDMDSDLAVEDLVRRGTCVPRAGVVAVVGGYDYEVRWTGDAGRAIAVGSQVVLSRVHPWLDAYRHPFVVLQKEPFKLVMRVTKGAGPDDVGTGDWRVDQAINTVSHDRMVRCVNYFAAQQTWPLQRLIVNDLEEVDARAVANSIDASAAGQAAGTSGSATGSRNALRARVDEVCTSLRCNASQRNAVLQSIDSWLTLVQGPPGTGKTQVAAALVRGFNEEGVRPVLAVATSNTAADNLARRLVQTNVAVRRGGPKERIGHDLHPISMQHMSASALGTGTGKSVKRQRREFEKDCVRAQADAVCTTSMSSGGPVLDEFTYELILVDEAAHPTEPDSLVPRCLGTHTARAQLCGDHQQLPRCATATGLRTLVWESVSLIASS